MKIKHLIKNVKITESGALCYKRINEQKWINVIIGTLKQLTFNKNKFNRYKKISTRTTCFNNEIIRIKQVSVRSEINDDLSGYQHWYAANTQLSL